MASAGPFLLGQISIEIAEREAGGPLAHAGSWSASSPSACSLIGWLEGEVACCTCAPEFA